MRNQRILQIELSDPAAIRSDVAQISGMPLSFGVSWCSVFSSVRVEVWSGRCATVRVVTKLMNVESVLPRGQSRNFALDVNRPIAVLLELDDSVDLDAFKDTDSLCQSHFQEIFR